jgi:hypothetical protein
MMRALKTSEFNRVSGGITEEQIAHSVSGGMWLLVPASMGLFVIAEKYSMPAAISIGVGTFVLGAALTVISETYSNAIKHVASKV